MSAYWEPQDYGIVQVQLVILTRRLAPSKKMIERSDLVFVLADSSKFLEKGLHTYASWQQIDVIITDHHVSPQVLDTINQKVSVYVAKEEQDEEDRKD